MDFWHVTNQGEGKIEKENSQPTLALDLHFTIFYCQKKIFVDFENRYC